MNFYMAVLVVFLTGVLLAGDYLIKSAVKSHHAVALLIVAAMLWVLSIPGWFYTLHGRNLSLVGMLFSVVSLIGSAMIGVLVFGETLSAKEWVGLVLGIVSAILLASKL
jgi:uncharacterized membrane protein